MPAKPKPIRRCEHIKVNGEQCGSPALKANRRCYFHNRWRVQRIDFCGKQPFEEITSIDFPVLEDANAIQVALMQVMRLLISRQFDAKLGGLLLYALQTASANLRHATLSPEPEKVVIDPRKVHRVGLREDAWTPPLPTRGEVPADMSPEDVQKLGKRLIAQCTKGEGSWEALRLWADLVAGPAARHGEDAALAAVSNVLNGPSPPPV